VKRSGKNFSSLALLLRLTLTSIAVCFVKSTAANLTGAAIAKLGLTTKKQIANIQILKTWLKILKVWRIYTSLKKLTEGCCKNQFFVARLRRATKIKP
jgi:hypothetical protein